MRCSLTFPESLTGKCTLKSLKFMRDLTKGTKHCKIWCIPCSAALITSAGKCGLSLPESFSVWETSSKLVRLSNDAAKKHHLSKFQWPCLSTLSILRQEEWMIVPARSWLVPRDLSRMNGRSTSKLSCSSYEAETSKALRKWSMTRLKFIKLPEDSGQHLFSYSMPEQEPLKILRPFIKLSSPLSMKSLSQVRFGAKEPVLRWLTTLPTSIMIWIRLKNTWSLLLNSLPNMATPSLKWWDWTFCSDSQTRMQLSSASASTVNLTTASSGSISKIQSSKTPLTFGKMLIKRLKKISWSANLTTRAAPRNDGWDRLSSFNYWGVVSKKVHSSRRSKLSTVLNKYFHRSHTFEWLGSKVKSYT